MCNLSSWQRSDYLLVQILNTICFLGNIDGDGWIRMIELGRSEQDLLALVNRPLCGRLAALLDYETEMSFSRKLDSIVMENSKIILWNSSKISNPLDASKGWFVHRKDLGKLLSIANPKRWWYISMENVYVKQIVKHKYSPWGSILRGDSALFAMCVHCLPIPFWSIL